ncbi:general stress protein [Kytococcus sedentarius]|uniref:general stress protein n=1 Tax=Kytococcus sedentarius TaxID=1276 RepID=UPI0035BC6EFE
MSTQSGMGPQAGLGAGRSLLELKNPRSVATYDDYTEAQGAVDHLSDKGFPVDQLAIVGSDLRQVERVTGRLSWGRVLLGGLLSGLWLGAFVGLIMSLFSDEGFWAILATTLLAGALFGAVWAALGYAMTRGRRDFTSVTAVVATSYEILAESAQVASARELLGLNAQAAPVHEGPLRTYGEAVDEARRQSGATVDQQSQQAPQQGQHGQPEYGQQAPQQGHYGQQPAQDPHAPRRPQG